MSELSVNAPLPLIRWERAKTAIAEAQTVDEVKAIRDQAEALRQYAKQAKESLHVQNQLAEIKLRAERKAGELLKAMPKQHGARPSDTGSHDATPCISSVPKLSDIGITKSQSSRFQQIAQVDEKVFDDHIQTKQDKDEEVTTHGVLLLAKEQQRRDQQPTREAPPLPVGQFDVLYADPPWRYEFSETDSRQIENQYPTMTLADLCALDVPAADNALLLMWATAPKLTEALQVMDTWGFEYKTHGVWDKGRIGMGYWFRGQHELLLVGTKGQFSPPLPEDREASVYGEDRGPHSQKPDYYPAWIERAFPGRSYCELFARKKRPGWMIWGNEVHPE